jgi:hypothetical protein
MRNNNLNSIRATSQEVLDIGATFGVKPDGVASLSNL